MVLELFLYRYCMILQHIRNGLVFQPEMLKLLFFGSDLGTVPKISPVALPGFFSSGLNAFHNIEVS